MNSLLRRLYHEQQGQVILMVASLLVGLLGMAALSIDIGFALHAQRELQASADAAATAGALDLSNNLSAASAINTAYCYSGVGTSGFGGSRTCPPNSVAATKGYNAYSDLGGGVSMVTDSTATYPVVACLSQLTALGLACSNAAAANAIAVEEQVSAPTFFGRLFGINSITLKAQSLAAMKGGTPSPANIEIVMDTTNSMGNPDSSSSCKSESGISSPTKEDCAKWGVRTLLSDLSPCAAGLSTCPTPNTNPVAQVGILVFPGLTATSYDPDDYNCQTTQLTTSNAIAKYAIPGTFPPYYSVVPASSDYKTSDTSGLNGSSSDLVKAVDWKDGNNCTSNAYGLENNGGVSTFYAGVITEATTDLSSITGARAKMQDAIIFLSDGDANAGSSNFTSAALTAQPTIDQNECQAAVNAATTAAGTKNSVGLPIWVYSIAYGSSTLTSGSCSTDGGKMSGCKTMTEIASDANKFYSDDANGCVSAAHPSITDLGQIFTNIAYDFLTTRLLPTAWYNSGTW